MFEVGLELERKPEGTQNELRGFWDKVQVLRGEPVRNLDLEGDWVDWKHSAFPVFLVFPKFSPMFYWAFANFP